MATSILNDTEYGALGVLLVKALSSRNWVKTTFMPGVATHNTLHPQPTTFAYPIFFNCFNHVVGASGVITAVTAKQWRDKSLVKMN